MNTRSNTAADDEAVNYDRALQRIERMALLLAAAGAIGAFVRFGFTGAVAFAAGAAISFFSLRSFARLSESLGGGVPAGGSAAFLAFRYVLMAGLTYAIVNYLEASPAALLAGLLVVVAAVLAELVYELVSRT